MKLKVFNGSEVFFTSDTHFDHEAIIWLCNRPFTCVEEMNDKLIENWNATVGPGDTVFHLGDFLRLCVVLSCIFANKTNT